MQQQLPSADPPTVLNLHPARTRSGCLRGCLRGWTLLELLIVLALSGIASAAAVPMLREQAVRLRRADGMAALQAAHLAQERHRSTRSRYAENMSALGMPSLSPSGHDEIGVVHADEATFGLTATARTDSPQTSDTTCWRIGIFRTPFDVQWMRGSTAGEMVEDQDRRCWPR